MHKHKKIRTKKAFSLLEVLLSVFVMSVGLMVIVAVISGSLNFSYDTRDNIVATELAQEGIELVRNVRDNSFAAGNDGFTSFDNKKHCRISVGTSLTCQNNRENANKYYLQYSGGLYDDINDTEERYSRFISIDYQSDGGVKRATVRSFVVWGDFTTSTENIPNNGDPARCNASTSCVYTETFLTSWR